MQAIVIERVFDYNGDVIFVALGPRVPVRCRRRLFPGRGAEDLLADQPDDVFLKSQLAWVYYDRIKSVREAIKGRLKPDQDLAHSMILLQLTKIGHKLPHFLRFKLENFRNRCIGYLSLPCRTFIRYLTST